MVAMTFQIALDVLIPRERQRDALAFELATYDRSVRLGLAMTTPVGAGGSNYRDHSASRRGC
jgi:hypothetical protein